MQLTPICIQDCSYPTSTTILGWIWMFGTLQANPHHIATLASCPAPETVGRMRSFFGAYKVLARVLPKCSRLMTPLDNVVAWRQSNEVISWSDDLRSAFKEAQLTLSSSCTITLPKPDDFMHTCILTDSKPCVQAFEKLCRSEFFSSPRVFTFLSVMRRFQASVRHVSVAAILPSDFASCNAPPCQDVTCQVCAFIHHAQESVVRQTSIQDILHGHARLPFTTLASWLAIQCECKDLRRTHAHLVQDTRPSKKLTNIKDLKWYLNVATVTKDALLVVKRDEPFTPSRECIIVPRQVLDGLLTALYIQLSHPSSHQLKMVTKRYLFALDMDKAIERVVKSCTSCISCAACSLARSLYVSRQVPLASPLPLTFSNVPDNLYWY